MVVADVNDVSGRATVEAIREQGGQADYRHADVSDALQVESMVAWVVERFGRLDCAVNNAGIVGTDGATSIANETEASWDAVISIDLKGVFLCCKHEVRQMLTQGGGAIVNMSSVMGLNGGNGGVAYSAAKHGVIGITKSVALSGARHNIRANAICPGIMRTPLVERLISSSQGAFEAYALNSTPMGRLGEADEVARTAAWLCSDAASYLTGVALPVDGGFNAQ